jgi:hypothetical protein
MSDIISYTDVLDEELAGLVTIAIWGTGWFGLGANFVDSRFFWRISVQILRERE